MPWRTGVGFDWQAGVNLTGFSTQIKTTSDVSVRSVKDIEEDVDMGSMAAELSGDPIFKEKATLQKKLGDLERSNKGFLQNRYNLEDSVKRENILLDHYSKRISTLEDAIPLLDRIPRDDHGETILNGNVRKIGYTKLTGFGRALLEEAEYAKKYKIMGKPIELGSLWNFKVYGEVTGLGYNEMARYVTTPNGDKIGNEKPIPEGEMAIALQVRDIILTMPSELERVKKAVIVSKDNLVEYRKQLGAENPFSKEVETSRNRLEEINMLIKERNKAEKEIKEENKPKQSV